MHRSQSPFTRKSSQSSRKINKNKPNRYNKKSNNFPNLSLPKLLKLIHLFLSSTAKNPSTRR